MHKPGVIGTRKQTVIETTEWYCFCHPSKRTSRMVTRATKAGSNASEIRHPQSFEKSRQTAEPESIFAVHGPGIKSLQIDRNNHRRRKGPWVN
jgi:hypothetical protein